ncbi:hypothetical protein [Roseibium sp.]|uniref:hypothetical protein n=1 Tax=Roseibium sp. TaxID=1936156 RepID=UPI003262D530
MGICYAFNADHDFPVTLSDKNFMVSISWGDLAVPVKPEKSLTPGKKTVVEREKSPFS